MVNQGLVSVEAQGNASICNAVRSVIIAENILNNETEVAVAASCESSFQFSYYEMKPDCLSTMSLFSLLCTSETEEQTALWVHPSWVRVLHLDQHIHQKFMGFQG